MRKIAIALMRAYQIATVNMAPRCKYYPSCSNYAITAVGRYGVKGFAMAIWRIARCNPWSQGGADYVDENLDSADVKNLLPINTKEVVGANK
jgi:putative membrane protein insertion efficiency factor